jgi:putative protein-disulfide isomerase
MNAKLYYVHDPMCSWCWGFKPVWQSTKEALLDRYPDLEIEYVLGGLAPDSNEPMPLEMRQAIPGYWRRIEEVIPGTKFNYDFWEVCEPRRSTYPACRAVLAAKLQKPESQDDMIVAIQQAYYLNAKNPSDVPVLVECADSIGLNPQRFEEDIKSEYVESELQENFATYRMLAMEAGANGFPSLVVKDEVGFHHVQVYYQRTEEQVAAILDVLG